VPRVIDTGAYWSVAPCIQAFVSEIKELCETLQTLDGTINVSGSDFVEWNIQDRDGIQKTIRNRALYVPAPGERLFSPRTYFHENKGGSLLCKPNGLILTLPDGSTLSLLATNFQSPVHAHHKAVRGGEATQKGSPSHQV
jgi:hypothetical protein